MTSFPRLHSLRRSLAPAALALALLHVWGCSGSTGPANSTNTAAPSNAANRATPPASPANTAVSNTSNTAASNTGNAASNEGVNQDFTLVNSTGVEINKLFVSPHDKDDWEEDVLGRDTLPTGQSVEIKFNRDEQAAIWDLKVEDKQGNSIVWENLNLLEISKITLYYENGRARAVTE